MYLEIILLLLTLLLALMGALKDQLPGGSAIRWVSVVLLFVSTAVSIALKVRSARAAKQERKAEQEARFRLEGLARRAPPAEDFLQELEQAVTSLLMAQEDVVESAACIWRDPAALEAEGRDEAGNVVAYLVLEGPVLGAMQASMEPVHVQLDELARRNFRSQDPSQSIQEFRERAEPIIWYSIRGLGYNVPLGTDTSTRDGVVSFRIHSDGGDGAGLSFSREEIEDFLSSEVLRRNAWLWNEARAWFAERANSNPDIVPPQLADATG